MTSKSSRRRARLRAERIEMIVGGETRLVHPNPPGGHGSLLAYGETTCQCDPCRRANTQHQLRTGAASNTRAKRFAERVNINGRLVHPDPYSGHGSHTAYLQCGCRCASCCAVHSDYMAKYRLRSST